MRRTGGTLTAWHQAGDAVPPEAAHQPVAARMAIKVQNGNDATEAHLLHFVVIHADAHVLAVYQVRLLNDYFMLRRMKRAPKDLVRLMGGPSGAVGNDAGNEEA